MLYEGEAGGVSNVPKQNRLRKSLMYMYADDLGRDFSRMAYVTMDTPHAHVT